MAEAVGRPRWGPGPSSAGLKYGDIPAAHSQDCILGRGLSRRAPATEYDTAIILPSQRPFNSPVPGIYLPEQTLQAACRDGCMGGCAGAGGGGRLVAFRWRNLWGSRHAAGHETPQPRGSQSSSFLLGAPSHARRATSVSLLSPGQISQAAPNCATRHVSSSGERCMHAQMGAAGRAGCMNAHDAAASHSITIAFNIRSLSAFDDAKSSHLVSVRCVRCMSAAGGI